MEVQNMIERLFAAIDSMQPDGFCDFITDDASFVFANYPPVIGKENIRLFLIDFYKSIKSLIHKIDSIAYADNKIFVYGIVTYTRHSGTTLTVKFCNVFIMEGELIKYYDIYMDASALYNE